MKRSDLVIELKGDERQPIFLRLVASIVHEIERGRIKPGEALPGTRSLARSLKLHRNTVDAAFHELAMQGWLVAEPSRGTFVAHDLPEPGPSAGSKGHARAAGQPRGVEVPPALVVSDGLPDPRIMPHAELARAFRRALSSPAFLSRIGYGDPWGAAALRNALAGYLTDERGLTASPDDLMVTRGSQMAVFLAAAAIIEPGQAIAVETPGYPLAWSAFRAAGARVIGIPVDENGVDVDHLAAVAEQDPTLRAVYITPHHQYPTTVTLGAGRRLKLLDIARRHGLTIIEDDYDHEYRFAGRPLLPLASRAEMDPPIVYIGSLSKLIAPAVRLGYAVARSDILARMADCRRSIDRQGDAPLEQAIAELIQDGALRRHARKARRIYQGRRDLLVEALHRHLDGDVLFDVPAGGLAVWVRLRAGLSAELWAANAERTGLSITAGSRFALTSARVPEAFRIGYANLDEAELATLVGLLAKAKPL